MAGSGSGAPDSNVGTPPMSADLHALSPLEKVSTPVLNGEFSEQRSRVALIWAHLGDPADQEGGEDGLGLGDGDGLLLEEAGHLACGRCSLSSGWSPHNNVFFLKWDYLPLMAVRFWCKSHHASLTRMIFMQMWGCGF